MQGSFTCWTIIPSFILQIVKSCEPSITRASTLIARSVLNSSVFASKVSNLDLQKPRQRYYSLRAWVLLHFPRGISLELQTNSVTLWGQTEKIDIDFGQSNPSTSPISNTLLQKIVLPHEHFISDTFSCFLSLKTILM